MKKQLSWKRAAVRAKNAKWLLAAVAALLMASYAGAQQTIPYTQNFDSETQTANPTGIGTGAKFNTYAGLANAGWRTYFNTTSSTSANNKLYGPHVSVSGNANVWVNSGTKSLSLAGRAGHGTNPTPGFVLLPTFDQPVNSLKIRFWLRTSTSASSELFLNIGYVTGTNYTASTLGTDVNLQFESLMTIPASSATLSGTWVEAELTGAPATATRIAIKLNVPGGSLRYCCIDDVEVTALASCLPVSNLTATADYTSAALSWTDNNGSTQWQVSVDGGAAQTVNNTSYTVSGLTPGTAHTVSVAAVCDGETSNPTTVDFTTTSCLSVTNLTATADYTSATLSWTEPGPATQWQVSLDGGSPVTVNSPTYTFTGLAPNTDHTATVRTVCAAGIDAEASVAFRTVCPQPQWLAIASLVNENLTLTWQGSASQYEVQLASDEGFSSLLTSQTVGTTTATFSGLTVGQYYYARVRANCGSDHSEWSSTVTIFMTDFSSAPATGLYAHNGTVVLNDLEPHTWSLYTTDVDKPLRSLNPLDAKITYRGYGTNNVSSNTTYNQGNLGDYNSYVPVRPSDFTASSAADDVSVGISQEERQYHTFEYYMTLERVDGKTAETEATGRVEYRTIFNPFSRRPTYGDPADYDWATTSSLNGAPCWRGFYKWRIDRIAGGTVFTTPTGGTALAVGDMVRADQRLYFESTNNMEVDFTAMWAPAIVKFVSYDDAHDGSNVPACAHGHYTLRDSAGVERNFIVCDDVMKPPLTSQSVRPYLPLASDYMTVSVMDRNRAQVSDARAKGAHAGTYSSVFPNGTLDGVEPAYGPVKADVTTARGAVRHATYIDLCPGLTKAENSVIPFNCDVRFEYLAFSRLRGTRNGFHLDGSPAAMWGTIAGNGLANLTLGRGIEPMFDDNKGTFNYIWGVGPISEARSDWGCQRSANNEPLNEWGEVVDKDARFRAFNAYYTREDCRYTIRVESGYIGCVMTMSGWNSGYMDVEGNELKGSNIYKVSGDEISYSVQTPANRLHGERNYARFIMGTDFDRADEAQRVAALGTDYEAVGIASRGRAYESLDSMLYHEVYKNAKVKIYRPFRVSSFTTQMNNQDKDSVYSDMIVKSGFVGQENIDRGIGHEEGATGSAKPWGRSTVDGITRTGSTHHWTPKSIYNVASNNNNHRGKRRMLIEGGFLNCSVSGGAWDRTNDLTRWYKTGVDNPTTGWGPNTDGTFTPNDVSTIRMKGGIITGSMFGGGNTYTASGGGRQMILTGGIIRAWIAGGVNGSDARSDQWEGIHYGNAWIYAGGTLHVGSGDTLHTTVGDTVYHPAFCGINGATDGQIFGAGCGIRPNYFRADSVEVDHQWNMNAWKHHRMGRVDSSFVYIADQAEVEGDVYGGGNYGYNNTEDGDDYNPAWDNGTARNIGDPDYPAKGKATLRILGGTVGGRLFGGANHKMGPEVDILMTGGTVKRGIYGGSNTWGYIKKDVVINLLGGTVGERGRKAIICGGGLGKETAVFGNITLNIGAAGTPGPVLMADVYGGSQNGTTNTGSTTKAQIGTFNSSPSHGSGGTYIFYSVSIDTAAAQGHGYNTDKKTTLNIYSGLVDGNVFGGGFGPGDMYATTYGDITVNFLGGEVMENIYGANDASGKPMGKVNVYVGSPDSVAASVADGNLAHRNRPVVHGSVYGGGRNAPYGTGSDNYTPVVEMFSGTVGQNVFGGGHGQPAVIDLHDEDYATKVLIRHGTVQGNVYGGGNAAKVIGDTRVVIGGDGATTGSISITVSSANPSMGSASGGGSYSPDQDVVISATPNAGYRFVRWSDGNTSNPRTVSVSGDATYTAEFEATYNATITVTANNPSLGTFTGGGSHPMDANVTIEATPNTGIRFTGWSDGVPYNPRTVKVTGDATYTALLENIPQYTLTVSPNNAAYGSVSGSGTFYEGEITSISATPAEGYLFRRWSDNETYNPRTLSLTSNLSLTAIFEVIPTYTINVACSPSGGVAGNAWLENGAYSFSYLEGTSVSILAEANTGYRFTHWNDFVTTNPRTITVTANATYTAFFEPIPQYTITAVPNNASWGTVTGDGTYFEDTRVTLQATPNAGYMFVQWSDGSNANPRTFFATEDLSLTAEFGENVTRWIDLGLPSGLLWADRNVDATSPEGTGGYYAWAETTEKINYSWTTTAYYGGNNSTWTKYNGADGKMTLDPADDVATQRLGGNAYMPSAANWQELFDNCTKSNATVNRISGYRFTSRINGNSIFLPTTGYKNGTNTTNIYGGPCYWSSTRGITADNGVDIYFEFNNNFYSGMYGEGRFYGFNVRAVSGGDSYQITVETDNASHGTVTGGGTFRTGSYITLTATPSSNGYAFIQWNDGNTDNPRIVTVTGDATYTATFQPLIYATGFEDTDDNATWTLDNGSYTNKWYIGTAAANTGSRSLYISSDSGTSNSYRTISTSIVFAYRTVSFTAGTHNLNFSWRGQGEENFDFFRVFLVPDAQTPSTTHTGTSTSTNNFQTQVPSGWIDLIPGKLNSASDWANRSATFTVPTNGNYKLVFIWLNDGSGGSGNPAIDDIRIY
ncbi:MAG: hypothetical protein J6I49_02385 [Bacteroidales bacterium]|nr:hypothetical protein [Bacteroidales bacterium]